MLGIFRRGARAANTDTALLGKAEVALRLGQGSVVPAACTAVAFDAAGHIRRIGEGARVTLADGDTALCFHPGPYRAELVPFAAAPEIGLSITFAIDADPRVTQQRFDLFLVAEVEHALTLGSLTLESLTLESLTRSMQAALRRELEQGSLELPPCTSLAEWSVFRAGLNQLLYMRFGVTVDDCVPVDLGERVDYAALLRTRVAGAAAPAEAPSAAQCAPVASGLATDRQALRRLFLELPCVMCALRLALLPPGQALFRQHQALLQRLDLVSLEVATMPALELAAPGQTLAAPIVTQRTRAAQRAVTALDEAWACLARLNLATPEMLAELLNEFDRIVANLEQASANRRATGLQEGAPC